MALKGNDVNEWLIQIGIDIDDKQNVAALETMIKEIKKFLQEEAPQLHLDWDNAGADDILRAMKELGMSLNTIKNSSGQITSFTTNLKGASGAVVTLNSNLRTTYETLDEIKQRAGDISEAWDIKAVANLNAGELLNNTEYATGVVATSTTSRRNNPEYMLNEIIEKYRLIQQLQSKLTGDNFEKIAEQVSNLRTELSEYINKHSVFINQQELNDTTQRNGMASVNQLTNEAIKILNEKLAVEKKISVVTGEQKVDLQQQQQQLDKQYNTIRNIMDSQRIGTPTSLVNTTINDSLEELDKIKDYNNQLSQRIQKEAEENKLAEELKNNLNEQLKITQQYYTLKNANNQSGATDKSNTLSKLLLEEEALKKQLSSYTDLNNIVEEYSQKLDSINAKQAGVEDNKKIKEAVEAYKQLKKAEEDLFALQKKGSTSTSLKEQKQVVQDLNKKVEKLTSTQLSNGKTVSQNNRYMEQANQIAQDHASKIRNLDEKYGATTLSLGKLSKQLKDAFGQAFQWNIGWEAVRKLEDAVKQSIETTKELDAAMTDMRLVTGQTGEEARKTMQSYIDLADQLGVTTKAVTDGSLEWLRQGKSIEDTTTLLTASTKLAKLGAMDSSESTQQLTALMNGYKLSVEETVEAVDKLVGIDLIAATSTGEMATALQRVSSLAESTGISLDRMIGMIATVSETTRLSAETVGTSMRSILSRLENVKAGKSFDEQGEAIEYLVA